jgi:hypothetical protein
MLADFLKLQALKAAKSLQTSVERSKRMIRNRCKVIRADRMLTLSTRQNETCLEVWAKWWDEFRRRLNKLQDFHYVAVLERQKRGAWHIPVAVLEGAALDQAICHQQGRDWRRVTRHSSSTDARDLSTLASL